MVAGPTQPVALGGEKSVSGAHSGRALLVPLHGALEASGQDTVVGKVLRRCADLVAGLHGSHTASAFVRSRSVRGATMLSDLNMLSARDVRQLAYACQRVSMHGTGQTSQLRRIVLPRG